MVPQGKFILSLLVSNESGVLTRISGLFARRGFNIDSLSVGETQSPDVSRITILATGGDYIREQIVRQLEKLHDVQVIELMDLHNTVVRELLLLKVRVEQGRRSQVLEAVSVFRAKVIDLHPDFVTVEITGEEAKLEAFLTALVPYEITELCRTGVTAIGRGSYVLPASPKAAAPGEEKKGVE
jgi:acetolactate synthase-1/3 small subunit